jgi:carbon storage regulator CsrA
VDGSESGSLNVDSRNIETIPKVFQTQFVRRSVMLVLSRKRDERILIGSDIEVKVLSVQGKYVRLGINCPPEVRILRSEVVPDIDVASLPKYSLETAIRESC